MRRTRIIATIGPASSSPAVLDALVAAGLDVARLNASHVDIPGLGVLTSSIREAAARAGREVAVMLDLPGPKLRVGDVAERTVLVTGEPFRIEAAECVGDARHACVTHPGLWRDVMPGDHLLLDDGRIDLVVVATAEGVVDTEIASGGLLSGHKGVNVPGRSLDVEAVTDDDLELIEWGVEAGVDLFAQSFVRSGADVERLRDAVGPETPIVAKIEKHEAIDDLERIIAAADAVMVARGDLGVEVSVEAVPVLQRRIVRAARAAAVPVVVATQMLESMTHANAPTRAEASDVASAVFEGVDALMLSGETAVGEHPVETLQTMARIIEVAEADDGHGAPVVVGGRGDDVTAAVSAAAVTLAAELDAPAIVTPTTSGATARAVAAQRPGQPIVAATTRPETARRLGLVWGVTAAVVPAAEGLDETLALAVAAARRTGMAHAGDLVVITAGSRVNRTGATDLVRVARA
jgi:pyruvate kinase